MRERCANIWVIVTPYTYIALFRNANVNNTENEFFIVAFLYLKVIVLKIYLG